MPLPRHDLIPIDTMIDVLHGRCQQPLRAVHVWRGCPSLRPELEAHRTAVPYLIMPLPGATVQAYDDDGVLQSIPSGEALLWCSGSLTSLQMDSAATWLRCTWDVDRLFLARAETDGRRSKAVGEAHNSGVIVNGPPSSLASALLERLQDCDLSPSLAAPLVHSLLIDVLDCLRSQGAGTLRGSERWRDVLCYMEQHAHRPRVDRQRVAEAFGIHPNHLTRLLRQHYGKGYAILLQGIRLRKACGLLQETDLDLQRIAVSCGLSGAGQLLRLFKKHYGCTPGAWRARAERPQRPTP
ncbi:MAG: helix-turn-helix transcriptional regulator [Planctomycetota bacterium]